MASKDAWPRLTFKEENIFALTYLDCKFHEAILSLQALCILITKIASA